MNIRTDSRPQDDLRLFWILQAAGWSAYFVLTFGFALAHGKPADYWTVNLTTAIAGFVATLGLRWVLRALTRHPPLVFLAGALLPILLAAGAITAAYVWALLSWCPDACRPASAMGYVAYGGSFLWIVIAWAGLYWGIKNHQRLQQQTQTALQANAMAHEAQLKMLRYQLNPHFLFNTLNAISTLILDHDTGTANRMLASLSAFLRHSLDADPMQRVSLRQELEAINLYLGIEKLRFAERLQLSVDIEPQAYAAAVPSLLLQPLVENAIKYAVARRVEGGAIGIAARVVDGQLEIVLGDDGPGFPAPGADGLPEGRGVGLRNARERLRVLFGPRQSFVLRNRQPRGAEVVLRLPFERVGAPRD
jgi:two-component system LytT family sensor kinase